jgi:hypothetical protein
MIKQIFIFLTTIVVLSSCTHNNGDIGVYFGTWSLDKIEINGSEDAEYEPQSYTWSFQNQTIQIMTVNERHDYSATIGSWEEISGKTLRLNFNHSDNNYEAGSGQYYIPNQLHIPQNASTDLDIISQSSKSLILQYVSTEGITYRYTLSKTW